ncbi:MAG: penicillin-binding protein 2 [Candidatus Kerfeldbacteria bacterium]|nr:penicillin-binding protein 2 [Candidatus Kerfeldbacteria bacterium]
MKDRHLFAPVPLSAEDRPIVLKRDRRAVEIEDHFSVGETTGRLTNSFLDTMVIGIVMAAIFAIMMLRIAYLQVTQGDAYRQASERNRVNLETIYPTRGIIFDRHRTPFLANVPNFTLFATPADLPRSPPQRQEMVDNLLTVYPKLNRQETTVKIVSASYASLGPVILAEHIEHIDAIRLSTAIARMPGITLRSVSARSYTDGEASAHVIGYLGKPTAEELAEKTYLTSLAEVGRMGVELAYDKILRGVDGVREVERDSLNKELAVIASRSPTPGKNLVLSIDRGLQTVLNNALKSTVNELGVPGGAAVALDPRSGEVLALVSQPSFDPNLFTSGGSAEDFKEIFENPRHPLFFRPISGSYPSGSTIKPLVAAAALADGIITEKTTVQSTGGLKVGPNFFPDWKAGGHGLTDVRKALAESVNTFFYTIGGGFESFGGLGLNRLVDYFQFFGLGQKLGVDLPNEASGFLPTAEWRNRPSSPRWYLGDTYHLAIGQGFISVTPLQVASYTAAIANGGTLYQPRVVKQILSPDGSIVQDLPSVKLKSTINDRYLKVVRSGMREAVTTGSARGLGSLPVPVAAKTGTAQFGEGDGTHAWLTSFAPFDRPEIVITVVIEQGGEGSVEALPVARQGLDWYFRHRPAP